jgi:hypothetical protein
MASFSNIGLTRVPVIFGAFGLLMSMTLIESSVLT